MKIKGLCSKGVVPDFYGTITKIQPALWPGLHMFLEDKLAPNAIVIEYIPNMQPINLFNFSKLRLMKLRHILNEIHQARVYHGDPKPRNMMICSGEQERVLWIDFDTSQTFSESGDLSSRHQSWVEEEVEMMDYFAENLVGFFDLLDDR